MIYCITYFVLCAFVMQLSDLYLPTYHFVLVNAQSFTNLVGTNSVFHFAIVLVLQRGTSVGFACTASGLEVTSAFSFASTFHSFASDQILIQHVQHWLCKCWFCFRCFVLWFFFLIFWNFSSMLQVSLQFKINDKFRLMAL